MGRTLKLKLISSSNFLLAQMMLTLPRKMLRSQLPSLNLNQVMTKIWMMKNSFNLTPKIQLTTHHSTAGPSTNHQSHTITALLETLILDKTSLLMDTPFTTVKSIPPDSINLSERLNEEK